MSCGLGSKAISIISGLFTRVLIDLVGARLLCVDEQSDSGTEAGIQVLNGGGWSHRQAT